MVGGGLGACPLPMKNLDNETQRLGLWLEGVWGLAPCQ